MSGSVVNNSGSENWETYTDNSDADEADAADAYYAKVHAPHNGHRGPPQPFKRPATSNGTMGAVKRVREQPILEEQGRYAVDGSETGWTDDGEIGETYCGRGVLA
jgi:protein regulator of cytokinesis 1